MGQCGAHIHHGHVRSPSHLSPSASPSVRSPTAPSLFPSITPPLRPSTTPSAVSSLMLSVAPCVTPSVSPSVPSDAPTRSMAPTVSKSIHMLFTDWYQDDASIGLSSATFLPQDLETVENTDWATPPIL
eukprot:gene42547-56553_t